MRKLLFSKIKEALFSVLPVTLIVMILNVTPLVNLSFAEILIFSISAVASRLCIHIGNFADNAKSIWSIKQLY